MLAYDSNYTNICEDNNCLYRLAIVRNNKVLNNKGFENPLSVGEIVKVDEVLYDTVVISSIKDGTKYIIKKSNIEIGDSDTLFKIDSLGVVNKELEYNINNKNIKLIKGSEVKVLALNQKVCDIEYRGDMIRIPVDNINLIERYNKENDYTKRYLPRITDINLYKNKDLRVKNLESSFIEDDSLNNAPIWCKIKSNEEIEKTAKSIVNKDDSSYDKARKICLWISENIIYDNEIVNQNMFPTYASIEALKNKRTICLGYACLYTNMLKAVGVESNVIKGEVLDNGDSIGHAWNSVKTEKGWIGVDITLSSTNNRNVRDLKLSDTDKEDLILFGETNNKEWVIPNTISFGNINTYNQYRNGEIIVQK